MPAIIVMGGVLREDAGAAGLAIRSVEGALALLGTGLALHLV
jgi:hypothetical protein